MSAPTRPNKDAVASQAEGEIESDAALHARLLARDPTAPSDLAVRHLELLTSWLLRTVRDLDPHVVEEIAIDLILSVAERPEQYDPEKSPLATYLRMAASGDVRNKRVSLGRRARHEMSDDDVELAARVRNIPMDADDAVETLARRERESRLATAIRDRCNEEEWQVLLLMMDRERHTSAFAAILGVTHLSELEQAREVKKVKDRLTKRLRRLPEWNLDND